MADEVAKEAALLVSWVVQLGRTRAFAATAASVVRVVATLGGCVGLEVADR